MDFSQPYNTVVNDPHGRVYEQDGLFYNSTGMLWVAQPEPSTPKGVCIMSNLGAGGASPGSYNTFAPKSYVNHSSVTVGDAHSLVLPTLDVVRAAPGAGFLTFDNDGTGVAVLVDIWVLGIGTLTVLTPTDLSISVSFNGPIAGGQLARCELDVYPNGDGTWSADLYEIARVGVANA